MNAKGSSWQNIYLRSAGFVSAALGLVSTISFFFSLSQNEPPIKWTMFGFGIVGIIVSYILGRDILDRFKYRGILVDGIPAQQVRLAQVGTRFVSVLWLFAGGLLLAFLFIWLLLELQPQAVVNLLCASPNDCYFVPRFFYNRFIP